MRYHKRNQDILSQLFEGMAPLPFTMVIFGTTVSSFLSASGQALNVKKNFFVIEISAKINGVFVPGDYIHPSLISESVL
jgi:hypothetical protein